MENECFETPEFKELLNRYEEMVWEHTTVNFDREELYQLADYYCSKDMLYAEIAVYQYAMLIHPDDIDIKLEYYNLLYEHDKHQAAKLLDSLLGNREPKIYMLRASLYLDEGKVEKAEEILATAAKLFKNDKTYEYHQVCLDIAEVYMEYYKKYQAYRWLKEAYKSKPEDCKVWQTLDLYHFIFGDVDKAITYCNKLLDEDAYHVDYWLDLCRCYMKQLKFKEAIEALKFVETIDEKNADAFDLKGLCYYLWEDEECDTVSLFDDFSLNEDLLYIASECFLAAKKYRKASFFLNKNLESQEHYPAERAFLYQKLAFAYLQLNELESCLSTLHLGFSCDSQNEDLYLIQAECFIKKGELEKARQVVASVEEKSGDRKAIKIEIAKMYFNHQLYNEALSHFTALEEESPDFMPAYYYYMALCYHHVNDEYNTIKYVVKAQHAFDYQENQKLISSIDKDGLLPQIMEETRRLIEERQIDPQSFL